MLEKLSFWRTLSNQQKTRLCKLVHLLRHLTISVIVSKGNWLALELPSLNVHNIQHPHSPYLSKQATKKQQQLNQNNRNSYNTNFNSYPTQLFRNTDPISIYPVSELIQYMSTSEDTKSELIASVTESTSDSRSWKGIVINYRVTCWWFTVNL